MPCQHKALPEAVALFSDSASSFVFDPQSVCSAVAGCLFFSAARKKQKELGDISGEHWNEQNYVYTPCKTAYFLN